MNTNCDEIRSTQKLNTNVCLCICTSLNDKVYIFMKGIHKCKAQ